MTVRERALVVDDDPDVRDMLAADLEELAFDVVTAPDGAAALAMCQETRFALIVTDLNMPHLDGLHFLERLRELDQDATVLVITGYPSTETALDAIVMKGACDYISKPFTRDDFRARVTRARQARQLRDTLIGG